MLTITNLMKWHYGLLHFYSSSNSDAISLPLCIVSCVDMRTMRACLNYPVHKQPHRWPSTPSPSPPSPQPSPPRHCRCHPWQEPWIRHGMVSIVKLPSIGARHTAAPERWFVLHSASDHPFCLTGSMRCGAIVCDPVSSFSVHSITSRLFPETKRGLFRWQSTVNLTAES